MVDAIGAPLIVGVAVFTTTILLVSQSGIVISTISTVIIIVIAGIVFLLSHPIYKLIGKLGVSFYRNNDG